MKFRDGLVAARSHIVFLLAVTVAFGLMYRLEKWNIQSQIERKIREGLTIDLSPDIPSVSPRDLTEEEREWARIAWTYFERNLQPETGLVNSVDAYPATTMWDTASYLMGLISAHRLGLVDRSEFDDRLGRVLETLARMPLFEDRMPNKSYSTLNAGMTTYDNRPTERGIGWSAIDMGRLIAPLHIVVWNYPAHAEAVTRAIRRWDMGAMIRNGLMFGAAVGEDGNTRILQEGRMGYEEYAAKAFYLMGMDVYRALRYMDFLEFVDIYGVQVPYDLRDPAIYDAQNYVLSESYILDGIEFGWDEVSREFAWRVYRAQEERYRRTGIPTAVSEDHLDQAPYFVYGTVFSDGIPWNVVDSQSNPALQFRTLSVKAAFGWHALYDTPYTRTLMDRVRNLHDPARGWFSGLYESPERPNAAIACNTNAVILESLCFIQLGRHVTLYEARTEDPEPATPEETP